MATQEKSGQHLLHLSASGVLVLLNYNIRERERERVLQRKKVVEMQFPEVKRFKNLILRAKPANFIRLDRLIL